MSSGRNLEAGTMLGHSLDYSVSLLLQSRATCLGMVLTTVAWESHINHKSTQSLSDVVLS